MSNVAFVQTASIGAALTVTYVVMDANDVIIGEDNASIALNHSDTMTTIANKMLEQIRNNRNDPTLRVVFLG